MIIRRFLGAIGALLVAAALTATSGANFQSASTNSANIIKAGVVSVTSTQNGTALLNVTGLSPGHSSASTVDITNSGDLSAALTLSMSGLTDTPASPALSGKVDLKIEDLGDPSCSSSCPATTTVYSGKLGAMASQSLGSWAAGAKHRFRFTVSMPDGGTGAEDAYQGGRSTVDYTWSAAQA